MLSRAEGVLLRRRAAEFEDLQLLAQWVTLHSDPTERRPGDALTRLVHPHSCDRAIADALDLAHRLPLTWAAVRALEGEVWVARKVATLSRDCRRRRCGSWTRPSPPRSPDKRPRR